DRFPERSARVLSAIASAPAGGVLVHCVGGRDRTGQITMLLLALAGVAPDVIAADYALSGPADEDVERFLAERGTSAAHRRHGPHQLDDLRGGLVDRARVEWRLRVVLDAELDRLGDLGAADLGRQRKTHVDARRDPGCGDDLDLLHDAGGG